jgi:hypothetical protein
MCQSMKHLFEALERANSWTNQKLQANQKSAIMESSFGTLSRWRHLSLPIITVSLHHTSLLFVYIILAVFSIDLTKNSDETVGE